MVTDHFNSTVLNRQKLDLTIFWASKKQLNFRQPGFVQITP